MVLASEVEPVTTAANTASRTRAYSSRSWPDSSRCRLRISCLNVIFNPFKSRSLKRNGFRPITPGGSGIGLAPGLCASDGACDLAVNGGKTRADGGGQSGGTGNYRRQHCKQDQSVLEQVLA